MQKNLIYIAYASLFLLGIADNIRGPLYPELLKEFHLINSEGALFFSLASSMVIVGGFFTGRALHFFSRLRVLQAGILLLAFAQLGMGVSPSFVVMLIFVFFFGISLGILGVAQNVLVIECSDPQHLQKWQSGLHSVYGFSSLLAPVLVSWVHSVGPDWRNSFYVCSALGLFIFFIALFLKDNGVNLALQKAEPIEINGKNAANRASDSNSQTALSIKNSLRPAPPQKGELIFYATILSVYVASEIIVSTRIVQFSQDFHHKSFDESMKLNMLFFIGLFVGRFLFVFWRPQTSLKNQMVLSLFVSFLSLICALLWSPSLFLITGLSMAPLYPLMMTAAGKLFPESVGKVTSYGIAISGITVVAMHSLVGLLTDQWGIQKAFFVGPVFSLLAFLMILIYPKLFNRRIP